MTRCHSCAVAAAVLAMIAILADVAPVGAQTLSWKSGASGDWSVGTNWIGDVAPTSPGNGSQSAYLHIDASKVSSVSGTYNLNVLTLTGTHPNLGIIEFGAGANVTAASMPTSEGDNRAIRRILNGGMLTINNNVSWIPHNSQLRINETGTGTGRFTVTGYLAAGRGGQSAVYIGGASNTTPVLNVSSFFRPEGISTFAGGRVVIGGALDVRTGTAAATSAMTGGHWTVGSLATRSGGLTMSGGTMDVTGAVNIRTGEADAGTGTVEIGGASLFNVNGTINVGFSSNVSASNQGTGVLRLTGNGRLSAPTSELRIGVGTYSDGVYEQTGGTATVGTVWVGYLATPNPVNPAGRRGYGSFLMSGGTLNATTFNIRGEAGATVAATGGHIAITDGAFNIRSKDETATVDLSGLTLEFIDNGSTLEAAGRDYGDGGAGFKNNYALGSIELAPNALLTLQDVYDNITGFSPEAVYTESLVLGDNSTLNLNNLNLYYHSLTLGSGVTFQNGTPLWVPTPEPTSIALLALAGVAACGRRRRAACA